MVFNRPDFAAVTAQAIAEQRPPVLYLASDGPRDRFEAEAVRSTRRVVVDIAERHDVEVVTLFRDENLGCRRAVESAVSWFFQHESEGIVLEDDCLPGLCFFSFCELMLARYRENPRVMHVSGYTHRSEDMHGYRYSRYPSVWGWATWSRAWNERVMELPPMEPDLVQGLRSAFSTASEHAYFIEKFEQVRTGQLDTWDFTWAYSLFVRQALTIRPTRNLVRNCGVGDPRAAHTRRARTDVQQNHALELDLDLMAEPKLALPDFHHDRDYFNSMVAGRMWPARRALRALGLGRPRFRA